MHRNPVLPHSVGVNKPLRDLLTANVSVCGCDAMWTRSAGTNQSLLQTSVAEQRSSFMSARRTQWAAFLSSGAFPVVLPNEGRGTAACVRPWGMATWLVMRDAGLHVSRQRVCPSGLSSNT